MCNCDSPELGFIDGDLERIFCAVCELVIGKWEDLIINGYKVAEEIETI